MMQVNEHQRIYYPALIIGLLTIADGVVLLGGIGHGTGTVDLPDVVRVLLLGFGCLLGIIWVVASYRLSDSALKCRILIWCCIISIVQLCAQMVAVVLDPEPVVRFGSFAVIVWSVLMIALNVVIARNVHRYMVSRGFSGNPPTR